MRTPGAMLFGAPEAGLGWLGIFRLGAVQLSLGAIVVLATSTLNRVMVVELALPAMLPGLLLGLHYAVQLSRPRWGYGSDAGGSRTTWIIGGMAVLALSIIGAAASTWLMPSSLWLGVGAALLAYFMIGVGVGAAGTSTLALMATTVAPRRRPAAATIVWLMMIFGIAFTAVMAGKFLDPFTPLRLLTVVSVVAALALTLATVAVLGIEKQAAAAPAEPEPNAPAFFKVLREVWAEAPARRFTIFVFVSMFAYNVQELILEPYAGHVFGYSLGESTSLAGTQHQGVFAGMLLVGIGASGLRIGSLKFWTVAGCLASAASLAAIAAAPSTPAIPLPGAVFALGLSNGAFSVAAIASMMGLASEGAARREGTRMGFWGAAQAVGFGLGAAGGALAADLMRAVMEDAPAYGAVFLAEGLLFVVAAAMALRITSPQAASPAAAAIAGE
ncbi:MAG: BCD family MFS transporter [Pseudomonadota bacterium]